MSELLVETQLLKQSYFNPDQRDSDSDTKTVTGGEALQDKVVAIYFSAAWCPPCQQFTPLLRDLFVEARKRGLPFQVVFVSVDRRLEEMEKYFTEKHGDWLLIPFDDPVQEYVLCAILNNYLTKCINFFLI